jgi:hypothetical protein
MTSLFKAFNTSGLLIVRNKTASFLNVSIIYEPPYKKQITECLID